MAASSIMDSNSYRADSTDISPQLQELIARREHNLGSAYRLFYRNPLHIVRAEGAYMYDADGKQYLDAYNNVASVGHCHPRVVQAVTQQMATLNTHTRYVHEAIVDYSDQLLATLPESISSIMFTCTGSESNDLALRVAQHYTGNTGIIITEEAYHGNSGLTTEVSPALGSAVVLPSHVVTVPSPTPHRINAYNADTHNAGGWFADQLAEAIAQLADRGVGVSCLLVDSIFSSDGIYPDPTILSHACQVVHQAGGVVIADEVQPGFGRTGEGMWGFSRHSIVPDIVTMGKPMGNGIPISAMAINAQVLSPFAQSMPYFNTFGGNPVSIAAAQAVLSIIESEDLIARAYRTGNVLRQGLCELAGQHPIIGDVRGAGLYVGVEIVDPQTHQPDSQRAQTIINDLREARILISLCGRAGNILKIRPPLVFSEDNAWQVIEAIDRLASRTSR